MHEWIHECCPQVQAHDSAPRELVQLAAVVVATRMGGSAVTQHLSIQESPASFRLLRARFASDRFLFRLTAKAVL